MKRLLPFLMGSLFPLTALAYSAVFSGDPVSPSTSTPYEILPGFPLVEAGTDGLLGSADDVVTPAVIGDIDLVVRSGTVAATADLPAPTIASGIAAVPVGVAGSTAAGGTPIPFSVFLSDGVTSASAPSGYLLTTADMDDVPVVVAAFADFDGDGFVGPSDTDASAAADNATEALELEAVGRGVALFQSGVARGTLAIRAGLPASRGGLRVLLVAMALTGPFDPSFHEGQVPSGPAVSTALPFLPERDLARLLRDRPVLAGTDTTLQQVIRYAALPSPAAPAPFALPLDGSSLTVDVAVVHSQVATKAALFEDTQPLGTRARVEDISFGTRGASAKRSYRLMPTDRFGNPADPPANFRAGLSAPLPLKVARPRSPVLLPTVDGVIAKLKLASRTPDGSAGYCAVEVDGRVVEAPRYVADSRLNRLRADLTVPTEAASIQTGIAAVYDRRADGILVVDILPGLYRETVLVNRPVLLRGAGRGVTVIQGDGTQPTLQLTTAGGGLRGLTVVGGGSGVVIQGSNAEILEVEVVHNLGTGLQVSASGIRAERVDSHDNGGNGFTLAANDISIRDVAVLDNLGYGIFADSVTGNAIEEAAIAGNGLSGVALLSTTSASIRSSHLVNNLDVGIDLQDDHASEIVGNLCALNDGDGISTDGTDSAFVSLNLFDTNGGYGMYVRRTTNADFDASAGTQAPAGDNVSRNNRKGEVHVRED